MDIIKNDWIGETCVIFASGSSVTQEQINYVYRNKSKCKVIAINAMYKKVSFADILYFCDWKFYKWHAIDNPDSDFIQYHPKWTISHVSHLPAVINRLKCGEEYGLSKDPSTLNHGSNSGYQCMNFAYLKGVKRIVLVGYDMKAINGKTHCHEPHFIPTPEYVYENIRKKGYFESIATALQEKGVEVINTSMNSALMCFQKTPLEEIEF
jgi:hypothetical protein